MPITKQDLLILKQRENKFLSLVESSSRDELAQCAKFLAMYLALYRQKYGEIPPIDDVHLSNLSHVDRDLLQIVNDGMDEASEMLKIVHLRNIGKKPFTANENKTVN